MANEASSSSPRIERSAQWNFWRGPPELLAHVVRVARRALGAADAPEAGKASCKIDFEVADDHEIFFSPSDFTAGITRQALRHFKSIRIDVQGQGIEGQFRMHWRRPWWDPWGQEKDAEVSLRVIGDDQSAVDEAFTVIKAAVSRGHGRSEDRQVAIMIAATVAVATAVTAGVVSALYLLEVPEDVVAVTGGVVGLFGLISGLVWGAWAYPSLEVAPAGQSNLVRATKFIGPVILSLVLTGVGKAVFG